MEAFSRTERMMRRWDAPFRLFEDLDDGFEDRFVPAVDSFVKDGSLIVKADVPGLDPKDMEVSVVGNVLTIKGERK